MTLRPGVRGRGPISPRRPGQRQAGHLSRSRPAQGSCHLTQRAPFSQDVVQDEDPGAGDSLRIRYAKRAAQRTRRHSPALGSRASLHRRRLVLLRHHAEGHVPQRLHERAEPYGNLADRVPASPGVVDLGMTAWGPRSRTPQTRWCAPKGGWRRAGRRRRPTTAHASTCNGARHGGGRRHGHQPQTPPKTPGRSDGTTS